MRSWRPDSLLTAEVRSSARAATGSGSAGVSASWNARWLHSSTAGVWRQLMIRPCTGRGTSATLDRRWPTFTRFPGRVMVPADGDGRGRCSEARSTIIVVPTEQVAAADAAVLVGHEQVCGARLVLGVQSAQRHRRRSGVGVSRESLTAPVRAGRPGPCRLGGKAPPATSKNPPVIGRQGMPVKGAWLQQLWGRRVLLPQRPARPAAHAARPLTWP
jgi:hypothetical protein